MMRLPCNGSLAQLKRRDLYGVFATLFRDGYYHARLGELKERQLQAVMALFGRPWDPQRPVSTVARCDAPRFITETQAAIPAHNECAYSETPPRMLALYCASNSATGGEFFALSPSQLLGQIGEQFLPSLHGARFACQMSEDLPAFETSLVRDTPAGKRIVFTTVPGMTDQPTYRLVRAVDEHSAQVIARLASVLNDPAHHHRHVWKSGDLIVLDNFRLMHGRQAFEGGERVLRHFRLA